MRRSQLHLLIYLSLGLCAPGCSDGSQPGPDGSADTRPADGEARDGRLDGHKPKDGGKDAKPADHTPDTPKKPAHWTEVPGTTPLMVRPTATLLNDGRVLFTGGYVQNPTSAYLDTATLYNPGKNSFVSAGKMATARAYHSATLLSGGRVLIVGGTDSSGSLTSTEIFDPKQPLSAAWSKGPSLAGPRSYHAAVWLKSSNDVLVLGGMGKYPTYLDSIAIFQSASNSWKFPGVSLGQKRQSPAAVLLPSGQVFIAAGRDDKGYLDTMESFNPVTAKITPSSGKLTYGRARPTATLLKTGRVLIVGGACGANCHVKDELYDPVSNQITPVTHPGGPPEGHTAVLLKDGRVLIAGGYETKDQTKVLAYSPASGTGSWAQLPSMKYGRARHAAVRLNDGSVLVYGGQRAKTGPYVSKAERFHP